MRIGDELWPSWRRVGEKMVDRLFDGRRIEPRHMAEAVQRAFLAGDRVEREGVRHHLDRGELEPVAIRILGKRDTGKTLPPHVADHVERAAARLVAMAEDGRAARCEQLGEKRGDGMDAAQAIRRRHVAAVEPAIVAGGAGVDKIIQALGDLGVGIAAQGRDRRGEKPGEKVDRDGRRGVPPGRVRLEIPLRQPRPNRGSEGMVEPGPEGKIVESGHRVGSDFIVPVTPSG